ncbi:FadR/GntR family transcriptional regulator [Desulfocicer niacini]
MKFNALQINSAPDVLVKEIISQIESGKLTTGECLPSQRELAKMFNVGLGSVREAIKMLTVLGYINVIRGKGSYITEPVDKNPVDGPIPEKIWEAMSLADIIAARVIVEPGAAKIAASQPREETIRVFKQLATDMENSYRDKDVFFELDFRFHIAVAEASNNSALIEITKLLVEKSHSHIDFMSDYLRIADPLILHKAVESARCVMACILDGDADASEEAMRNHINIVDMELDKELSRKKIT